MRVGSLFSGIGGLDLGLERSGMTVVWQSEIDPFCCDILRRHWPDVPNLGNVKEIDWAQVPPVDLLCGGYPCQPFSNTGRRQGATDERHLWPYMLEAIRSLRPEWVLLENVLGHLSLGFDRVLSDLAEVGFDAEWSVVSGCSVGAPHMRRRLFVLAYPHSERHEQEPSGVLGDEAQDAPVHGDVPIGEVAHSGRQGQWSAQPGVLLLADGIPPGLARAANRAVGNAVIPQVAEAIGRRVLHRR